MDLSVTSTVYEVKTNFHLPRLFASKTEGAPSLDVANGTLPKQIFEGKLFRLLDVFGQGVLAQATCSFHEYLIRVHGGACVSDDEPGGAGVIIIAGTDEDRNLHWQDIGIYRPQLILDHVEKRIPLTVQSMAGYIFRVTPEVIEISDGEQEEEVQILHEEDDWYTKQWDELYDEYVKRDDPYTNSAGQVCSEVDRQLYKLRNKVGSRQHRSLLRAIERNGWVSKLNEEQRQNFVFP